MRRFKILLSISWLVCPLVGCQSSTNPTPTDTPLDFESLTKQPSLFVDKTMLLETIFAQQTEGRILSITTPPGFGRTTNLKMIKYFATIPTDNRGVRLDPFNSSNARLFGLNCRPVLAVSRQEHVIRDHLAKYPVVYVDLSNVTRPSLRQTMLNLHERVKQSYADFDWLEDKKLRMAGYAARDDILTHDKHRKEWRYINKLLKKLPNAVDIQTSISKLIKVLVEEYNRKAILLIDNYDSPIMDAVYQRSDTSVDEFYEFFNVFFSTTLDDSVNRTKLVVLAGTHPLSVGIRTEIDYYNFQTEHEFSSFFGYTELEMEHLLALNPGSLPVRELRNCFGGFLANGSSTPLYNAKSATQYFKLTRGRDSSTSLAHLPSLYDPRIHTLVRKFMPNVTWQRDTMAGDWWGGRSFVISPVLRIDQLEKISGIVNGKVNVTDGDMDTYFTILFANGYFTHPDGEAPDVIAFPNFQMTTAFQRYLN